MAAMDDDEQKEYMETAEKLTELAKFYGLITHEDMDRMGVPETEDQTKARARAAQQGIPYDPFKRFVWMNHENCTQLALKQAENKAAVAEKKRIRAAEKENRERIEAQYRSGARILREQISDELLALYAWDKDEPDMQCTNCRCWWSKWVHLDLNLERGGVEWKTPGLQNENDSRWF
jgi:hypothetical protein